MAFSGAGTFNRIYTWVTDRINGVPITDTRMDAEMDGFATGLSTCVTKDGQTTTTAQIPFALGLKSGDGTAALPAITFISDTDSGLYRIGANNVGVAVNGAKVLDIATTGLGVTGKVSLNGDVVLTHPITPSPDNVADSNITLGMGAGAALVPIHSTQYLTLIGKDAGAALVDGDHITAVGAFAGASASATAALRSCTLIGIDSARNATAGNNIVAVGEHSMTGVIDAGTYGTAIGSGAGYYMGGDHNTALGDSACLGVTGNKLTGSGNVGAGSGSLLAVQGAASRNAGLGFFSLSTVTTGTNNIGIGYLAGGTTLTTGSGNILIGVSADTPAVGTNNYLNIGGSITGTQGSDITVAKVTITKPATGSTLTIPDGVTLTGPAASGTAMTLGNAETITGVKTFGSAGAVGKLKVAGTTSGTITLDAAATAGSNTLTLPAATDTLVGKATTDTLTNKTLTSPTLTTPALGTPSSGTLTSCTGLPATTGIAGVAYTVTTPTPTAISGTFTSVASSVRELKIGKTVFLQITVVVTTVGSAASQILVTVPTSAIAATSGSAVNQSNGSIAMLAQIVGTGVQIIQVAGGALANNTYLANLIYETA